MDKAIEALAKELWEHWMGDMSEALSTWDDLLTLQKDKWYQLAMWVSQRNFNTGLTHEQRESFKRPLNDFGFGPSNDDYDPLIPGSGLKGL